MLTYSITSFDYFHLRPWLLGRHDNNSKVVWASIAEAENLMPKHSYGALDNSESNGGVIKFEQMANAKRHRFCLFELKIRRRH